MYAIFYSSRRNSIYEKRFSFDLCGKFMIHKNKIIFLQVCLSACRRGMKFKRERAFMLVEFMVCFMNYFHWVSEYEFKLVRWKVEP